MRFRGLQRKMASEGSSPILETDFNQLLQENIIFTSAIQSLNNPLDTNEKNFELIIETLQKVRGSFKNQINNQRKDLTLLFQEETWKVLHWTMRELVTYHNTKIQRRLTEKFDINDNINVTDDENEIMTLKLGLKILQLYTAIIPKSTALIPKKSFLFYNLYYF